MLLHPHLRKSIIDVHAKEGESWLANLDATLHQIEQNHGITIGDPLPDLTYNLVCYATTEEGYPAILKLGPTSKEGQTEIAALKDFAGLGAVRLLQALPEGAILLERLVPGTTLESEWTPENDDYHSEAMGSCANRLLFPGTQPSSVQFPTAEQWASGLGKVRKHFDEGTGPIPENYLDKATKLFRELLTKPEHEPRLTHGDLHHGNVLSSSRGWIVIDPKGLIAEPAYEAGAALRNPRQLPEYEGDLRKLMDRRIDILADRLKSDPQRVRAYGFAQAVLSAWWSIEDHCQVDPSWLRLVEALATQLH